MSGQRAHATRCSLKSAVRDYVIHGGFEAEATLKIFNDAIEQAYRDGFTGFRAAAEMSWALEHAGQGAGGGDVPADPSREEVGEYAVCRYSRRRGGPTSPPEDSRTSVEHFAGQAQLRVSLAEC